MNVVIMIASVLLAVIILLLCKSRSLGFKWKVFIFVICAIVISCISVLVILNISKDTTVTESGFKSSESSSKHTMSEFSADMQSYFETWEDEQTKVFADLLFKCADELSVSINEITLADPPWGGEDLHRCTRFVLGDEVANIYMSENDSGEIEGYLELE